MRRPSFQFYPADWLGNTNLRRCSHAEKGIWIDIMCLMHDSAEYGILRWPLREVASAASCRVSELQGLISKGVMKGSDQELDLPLIYTPRTGRKDGTPVTLIESQKGPIWYCSRMVCDEHIRKHRGEKSRFQTDTEADDFKLLSDSPKASSKPPFGDGSSSSSSSSSSSTHKKESKNPKRTRATIEEVTEFIRSLGLPDTDAHATFYKWEGNGWTNGGKPIKDWKATIRSWHAGGYLPSQKNGTTLKQVMLPSGKVFTPLFPGHRPDK